jgi:hypothetical protein
MLNRPPQAAEMADATLPTGLADPTDPGPAPTFDTASVPPATSAPPEESSEASHLFAGFKRRPPRPPAPRPKQQASSDGGDFVAYSTVARPVPRTVQEGARARVRVEVARLAAATPLIDSPTVAGRDAPTQLVTLRRKRRRAIAVIAGVAGVMVLASALAVVLTWGSRGSGTSPSASLAPPDVTIAPSAVSTPSTTGAAAPIEAPPPQAPPEAPPSAPPIASPSVVPTATSKSPAGTSRPPPKRNNAPTDRFTW